MLMVKVWLLSVGLSQGKENPEVPRPGSFNIFQLG